MINIYIPSFVHKSFKPIIFCAVRLKINSGHLEYTEFRSKQDFYNIFGTTFYYICHTARVTSNCCYLPAVGVCPHNIRKRNQHTHWRHGASQIAPVHVHIEEHAYKCTEPTCNHCYHVHSINSRNLLHMNRNSCNSEEENQWTETTFRQSL
jgi:hypothetical protein